MASVRDVQPLLGLGSLSQFDASRVPPGKAKQVDIKAVVSPVPYSNVARTA
jgi:hypothetical protein